MGRHTLKGNPPIEVNFRHSARAKRLSLRVSRLDGRVTLTLPLRAPHREGIAFLQSKEDWLRGHLAQLRPVTPAIVGSQIMVRGRMIPIVATGRSRASLHPDRIDVAGNKPAGAQIRAVLRHHARDALAAASDAYAAELGQTYHRLTLRDTRSRWGSCTSQGGLMYSWRLIMAPPDVLDYVAAHEVAHLVEMNHLPVFWGVVSGLCPEYQTHRQWLRDHGDALHRVSFDD
jgi:predicted metal-dependent hydrolase